MLLLLVPPEYLMGQFMRVISVRHGQEQGVEARVNVPDHVPDRISKHVSVPGSCDRDEMLDELTSRTWTWTSRLYQPTWIELN
jgi:hypothetical protein